MKNHAEVSDPVPTVVSTVEDARTRLLEAGLRLFAQQGYSKTSTRELAEAAKVNVASISYYFGDKAGLYRAAFYGPMGSPEQDVARFNGEQLSLEQALRGFYDGFLQPLKAGDASRQCMKLHFREMLEPTGLWANQEALGIKPLHEALLTVLCRHLGLPGVDDDVQRLAVCLAGLGVHMHVGRDITDELAPQLNANEQAVDRWVDRLTLFAKAMVQAEAARRAG